MPTAAGTSATFATITVSTTAVGLGKTSAELSDAERVVAIVTVAGASIRFRIDETDPTSSVGHVADDTDVIYLRGVERITRFRAIRKGASDATLSVTFDYEH